MVFPKPEWIRYQVQLDRKPHGAYVYPFVCIYIYMLTGNKWLEIYFLTI